MRSNNDDHFKNCLFLQEEFEFFVKQMAVTPNVRREFLSHFFENVPFVVSAKFLFGVCGVIGDNEFVQNLIVCLLWIGFVDKFGPFSFGFVAPKGVDGFKQNNVALPVLDGLARRVPLYRP